SARAEQAEKLLKKSGALKTDIRTPRPVQVVARDCDSPKATWNDGKRRITICYSLVDRVHRTITGISQTEEADEKTTGARTDGALAVLFHRQLGHALTRLNGMPDSAEQADQFAALTLLADDPEHVVAAAEARHLLAGHDG